MGYKCESPQTHLELELCSLQPLCTGSLTTLNSNPDPTLTQPQPQTNNAPSMARNRPRWYVVTVGVHPGIYTSWL